MRIIPVLDLKGGQVVRGVAGRRAEYRPVESLLCADARPASVARAFVEKLGLREAYVADLDAIAGAEPAWDIYHELTACGLRLWVDAGAGDTERAEALTAFSARRVPLEHIIAGLESLAGPDALAAIAGIVGPERLVFSLDLKDGRPLIAAANERGWESLSGGPTHLVEDSMARKRLPTHFGVLPFDIAAAAVGCGVRSLIVLDLARVGVGQGVGTEPFVRQLRDRWPALELIAGGGVRSTADLASLAAAGCDAALVASALHDGRITQQEVQTLDRR